MVKSLEEMAAERRTYIEQAKAAFHNQEQGHTLERPREEPAVGLSGLGIRLLFAILLFAGFVYCDQEKITFQGYGTKDVVQQLQWNPLPTEELEELMKELDISQSLP